MRNWDAFLEFQSTLTRSCQKSLFPCAFDVVDFGLFFVYLLVSLLGPIHRPLHLSGVSLQSSDTIVEMSLRPDF